MGSCTAGGAYVPAMSDEAVIVKNQGTIFLGGPPLVKAATGENVTAEELGGADVHCRHSGVADHYCGRRRRRDADRANISSQPQPGSIPWLPLRPPEEPFIPPRTSTASCRRSTRVYDMREIIARIVDGTGFRNSKHSTARRWSADSRGSGVIPSASSPTTASSLPKARSRRHISSSLQSAARAACLPTEHHRLHGWQEIRARRHRQGRRKNGQCSRETRRPKVTVIIGGSYGAGNYGMSGRAYGPRFLWMWPNAASP